MREGGREERSEGGREGGRGLYIYSFIKVPYSTGLQRASLRPHTTVLLEKPALDHMGLEDTHHIETTKPVNTHPCSQHLATNTHTHTYTNA